MINNKPNMSRKKIFQELPTPSELDKKEEPKTLKYIYKGIYICVKLLLDMRLNLVKVSEGKQIKTKPKKYNVDNPVIKDTDKLGDING